VQHGSAQDRSGGPAELVLMASVARRYYLDGQSKIEIAEHTKLSRFKVARLLEKARATGLVRIEIGFAGPIDVQLSDRLQEAYGLRTSVVLDVPDDDLVGLRGQLGRTTAELLSGYGQRNITPASQLLRAKVRPGGKDPG